MNDHKEIDIYGYLKGEVGEDESVTTLHISGCDLCSREVEQTRDLLTRLDSLPEITPSPSVWKHLEEAVNTTNSKSRGWLQISMAAALLLGFLGILLLSTPHQKQVAARTSDRTPLYIDEAFSTSETTSLSVPDVGTLLVRDGSEVHFTNPRTLVLVRGEVFAEVLPSGKGFEIRHRDTRTIVQGTRFGVKAGKAVYVLEGRVRVIGPAGDLELTAGEAGTLLPGSYPDGLARMDLEWIQSPRLAIVLEVKGIPTVKRGEEITWRATFSSSTPLLLENLRNIHGPDQYLFLRVQPVNHSPYLIPIDPGNIISSEDGPVRIGPGEDAVLLFRVDSRRFRMDGRHRIFAIYTGKGTGGGQATSKPVEIEVQR